MFGSGENSGKLLAERIYFDNDTVLQQIRGMQEASSVPDFAHADNRGEGGHGPITRSSVTCLQAVSVTRAAIRPGAASFHDGLISENLEIFLR